MTRPPQQLAVGEVERGQRLDRFLADRLKLSRSQVRRLLERGAVTLEGRTLAGSAKGRPLSPGSVVEVAPFDRPGDEHARKGESVAPLLAEGEGWIAVDKPAGVPVHPLREPETDTVQNGLLERWPQIHGVGEGGLRSGVVHRLDVETSGVLLFATTESRWRQLRAAFSERRIDKTYHAIVLGRMEGEGSVEIGLVTARHRPARVRVVAADEWERARGVWNSQLHWRATRALEGATLLEVRPKTGFLHQIRVTLAHLGHPIAGDRVYGPPSDSTGAARHMLHASRIAYEDVFAQSPDAPDFAALVEALA